MLQAQSRECADRPGSLGEVGFHHLGFSHRFAMCENADGLIVRRWVPTGMPHINQNLGSCAFFLYRCDGNGNLLGPEGTGFIVSRQDPGYRERHFYAVTNWHVALCGASVIRINTLDGKTRVLEFGPEEWQFNAQGDDLAAVDITDHLNVESDDVTVILEELFATPTFASNTKLGFGDEVFMIGLFANHDGGERNLPLARFGNISAMPSDNVPIRQPNNNYRPSYVLDMRSRGGFSGSPVFVYRTPNADLTEQGTPNALGAIKKYQESVYSMHSFHNLFLRLLGVHCAQFPEEVKFETAEKIGDPIREGDTLRIASSMTVVVPAWRISELLDRPYFAEQRATRDRARRP